MDFVVSYSSESFASVYSQHLTQSAKRLLMLDFYQALFVYQVRIMESLSQYVLIWERRLGRALYMQRPSIIRVIALKGLNMNPKTATNDNGIKDSLIAQIGRDTFSPDNIRKCEDSVLKVQYQLDRAVEDDDRNKIRFLVHQLSMKSKATKIMAIYRICNINTGRFTAGVDGDFNPDKQEQRDWSLCMTC